VLIVQAETAIDAVITALCARHVRRVVENIGRYIAAYDSADSSLRLSWSGDQLFMNEHEVRTLLSFLQNLYLYEDSVR
jgi:hypothetical protein